MVGESKEVIGIYASCILLKKELVSFDSNYKAIRRLELLL